MGLYIVRIKSTSLGVGEVRRRTHQCSPSLAQSRDTEGHRGAQRAQTDTDTKKFKMVPVW